MGGSGGGNDAWRMGNMSEGKGSYGSSSSMMGSNVNTSGPSGRGGGSQGGWRPSNSMGSGDRWGGSSGASMGGGRGSSGSMGMDMVRSNPHHMNQQSLSSMAMSLIGQNDRFQMGNFRKY